MKKTVTYAFERDDVRQLSAGFVMEAFNMLEGYVSPGETDQDSPCPGYRALRKMRGNMFTKEDVQAFVEWMKELDDRASTRIAALRAERDAEPRDEHSLKAYDGLIEMMEAGRTMSLRHVAEFREAFQEEDSAMPAAPAM